MYRDAFKEDSKDFCRTGKHAKHKGIRTVVNGGLDLYSSPTGTYILKPIEGRWWFKWNGKPIYDYTKFFMYLENGIFDDVNIKEFITQNEDIRLECHRTAYIILNDLEASPPEKGYSRMYDRVGFIITGNQVVKFDVRYFGEQFDGLNFYIYDTWDSYRILDDIFEELRDALEELANEDEEIRNLISNLEKKHNTDINKILKYFNQTPDGNLQHKYDDFPMLFNSNYVDGVYKTIKADILSGVVYYDLRMSTKVTIPASTFVTIAECPLAFMPDLSSPSSWVVRNKVITDAYPEGTPEREPLLLDGKGVFAHTYDTTYGMVFIKTKDEIPAGKFLYLTGSYLMNPDNIGNLNLSKSIAEHGEFKLEENL